MKISFNNNDYDITVYNSKLKNIKNLKIIELKNDKTYEIIYFSDIVNFINIEIFDLSKKLIPGIYYDCLKYFLSKIINNNILSNNIFNFIYHNSNKYNISYLDIAFKYNSILLLHAKNIKYKVRFINSLTREFIKSIYLYLSYNEDINNFSYTYKAISYDFLKTKYCITNAELHNKILNLYINLKSSELSYNILYKYIFTKSANININLYGYITNVIYDKNKNCLVLKQTSIKSKLDTNKSLYYIGDDFLQFKQSIILQLIRLNNFLIGRKNIDELINKEKEMVK